MLKTLYQKMLPATNDDLRSCDDVKYRCDYVKYRRCDAIPVVYVVHFSRGGEVVAKFCICCHRLMLTVLNPPLSSPLFCIFYILQQFLPRVISAGKKM